MTKVLVTGMGVISSIGNNLEENHQSLQSGKTGLIKGARHFSSKFTSTHYFGEVKLSNEEIKQRLSVPPLKGLTRTDLLAFKAFEEAVSDASLQPDELSHPKTGLISGSTVGGMVLTDRVYQDGSLRAESDEFLESYDYSSHTLRLADYFKIKGFTNTLNTACSSSANAIMMGARLIQNGRAQRMIVGGTDSLAKFTVNGFNSLQILSSDICMPFDENRNGLNLGEGAAYLVLEAEGMAAGKRVYGQIAGFGNCNDAYHASSLSEDAVGVVAAMKDALDDSKTEQIDYINTHGTATENNDLTEITGIDKIFDEIPPYNSTKSYTGHTLAAAGAIEAVYSLLTIYHQELYPSLNCFKPITPVSKMPITKFSTDDRVNSVLSNSFGFGGNCTSLVFKSI